MFFISVRSLPVWWRHTLLPPIITSLIDQQSADYFLNFGRKLNVCFLLNLKRKKKTSWHQKTINSEIRTVSKSFHWSITALINEPITSALICFHSPTSTHNQYSDTLWLLISFVLLLFTFKMNYHQNLIHWSIRLLISCVRAAALFKSFIIRHLITSRIDHAAVSSHHIDPLVLLPIRFDLLITVISRRALILILMFIDYLITSVMDRSASVFCHRSSGDLSDWLDVVSGSIRWFWSSLHNWLLCDW